MKRKPKYKWKERQHHFAQLNLQKMWEKKMLEETLEPDVFSNLAGVCEQWPPENIKKAIKENRPSIQIKGLSSIPGSDVMTRSDESALGRDSGTTNPD